MTIDVDIGVTPFMIQCRSRSTKSRYINPKHLDKDGFCVGAANSCFYPKTPKPSHLPEPEWEWALPSEAELKEIIAKHPTEEKSIREYYDGTRLNLRPRSDKKPIYHDDPRLKEK